MQRAECALSQPARDVLTHSIASILSARVTGVNIYVAGCTHYIKGRSSHPKETICVVRERRLKNSGCQLCCSIHTEISKAIQ